MISSLSSMFSLISLLFLMEDILFHYGGYSILSGGFLFLMEVILLRKMDLFSMLSHYPQMSSLISLLFLMEDILFHYGGFLFLMEVILLRKMDLLLNSHYPLLVHINFVDVYVLLDLLLSSMISH